MTGKFQKFNLSTPISSLSLSIKGSWLKEQVDNLYDDLEKAGLTRFKPLIYLGDEWFSPDGIAAISIPFYLAHPSLRALELQKIGEVEGGVSITCMKLLRHEAGHCFDHLFGISKKRHFFKLFGNPNSTYNPEKQKGKPYSRNYVKHIDATYSQTHPCEDFAESFAVVITPGNDWRKKYKNLPNIKRKLDWVERQIKLHRNACTRKIPKKAPSFFNQKNLNYSIGKFYKSRINELGPFYLGSHDKILRSLFSKEYPSNIGAHKYISKNQDLILKNLSQQNDYFKWENRQVLKELQQRAFQLGLKHSEGRNPQIFKKIAHCVTQTLDARNSMIE